MFVDVATCLHGPHYSWNFYKISASLCTDYKIR